MFTYRVNENIMLRLPDMTDAPELLALFKQNRDHLTEWQDWPNAIQTLEDCRQFILRHQREYAQGKTLGCLILFQEKLVGMCELTYIVPLLRKAEIGYWIAEEYEGRRSLIQHSPPILLAADCMFHNSRNNGLTVRTIRQNNNASLLCGIANHKVLKVNIAPPLPY
jgi:hypothetical protein